MQKAPPRPKYTIEQAWYMRRQDLIHPRFVKGQPMLTPGAKRARDLRRAFFAGAAAFLNATVQALQAIPGDEPAETQMDVVQRLHDEIAAFEQLIEDGAA